MCNSSSNIAHKEGARYKARPNYCGIHDYTPVFVRVRCLCPAFPYTQWQQYSEHLGHFFAANKITDATHAEKRCFLFHHWS